MAGRGPGRYADAWDADLVPARGGDPWDHESGTPESACEEEEAEPAGGDSSEDEQATPEEELRHFCEGLYLTRKISARDLCTIFWWCSKCGVQGCEDLGFRPDAPSGHFQRKLNTAFPYLRSHQKILYEMRVPGWDRDLGKRNRIPLLTLPLHELVAESVENDPTLLVKLDERAEEQSLPEVYAQHPVVLASPEPVLPISIFVDGVPYSNSDSVVGFWVQNELSKKRSLFAVLRKSTICDCGCRGWCSYWAVFEFARWSLGALAAGIFPAGRHDGQPWRASDEGRQGKAGEHIGFRCAVVFLKGDWSEYCHTMGFPMWNDTQRPCFECNASIERLYEIPHWPPLGPWRQNEENDYFEACSRCEIEIVLEGSADRDLLLSRLARSESGRGICVTAPVLGLREGDRLVPQESLHDPGLLAAVEAFPLRLIFWRASRETLARNRCPLFNQELGVSPHRVMTVDTLHCAYLGVFQTFAKAAIWALVRGGKYTSRTSIEEQVATAVLVIRMELASFYSRQAAAGVELTHVTKFRAKTIGENSDPKLRTKGAETWGFLLFVHEQMQRRGAGIDRHAAFVLAGQRLVDIVNVWSGAGPVLSAAEQATAWAAWLEFVGATHGWEDLETPKRHLFSHMVARSAWFGNPKYYANWANEGDNHTLKKMCRTVSQENFEQFLLLRMRHFQDEFQRGAKRSRESA